MCQNHCVFLSKVARPTVSRARERPDPHQVRSLCIKVGKRPGRGTFRHTHAYPYLAARTPQCKHCLGNKKTKIDVKEQILPQRETPNSFLGEASGGIWEASGSLWKHLGSIWGASGNILEASWRHLEASGGHLGGIWGSSGRPLGTWAPQGLTRMI